MTNGLNINISEEQFKQAPEGEQNWMIFKAVEKIDLNGCSFGRSYHRKESWSKLVAMSGAFGGALVTAIAIWAFILK